MIKRAVVWMLIALIAALFGYSGWLDGSAAIARTVSLISVFFTLLSLMFCLFEPESSEAELEEGL